MVKTVRLAQGALAAGALALAGGPPAARAHPENNPQTVNRYLSIIVASDRFDVILSMLWGEVPGLERRKAMDRDGDGSLDEDEIRRERQAWRARAAELLAVELDGAAGPLEAVANVDVGSSSKVEAAPLIIEVAATLPLGRGPHRLTVAPREDPPRLGETEISIDLLPEWKLTASARGRAPPAAPAVSLFKWPAGAAVDPADRGATFELAPAPRAPGAAAGAPGAGTTGRPARGPSRSIIAASAVLAALATAGAAVAAARARRRQRARSRASDAPM